MAYVNGDECVSWVLVQADVQQALSQKEIHITRLMQKLASTVVLVQEHALQVLLLKVNEMFS